MKVETQTQADRVTAAAAAKGYYVKVEPNGIIAAYDADGKRVYGQTSWNWMSRWVRNVRPLNSETQTPKELAPSMAAERGYTLTRVTEQVQVPRVDIIAGAEVRNHSKRERCSIHILASDGQVCARVLSWLDAQRWLEDRPVLADAPKSKRKTKAA